MVFLAACCVSTKGVSRQGSYLLFVERLAPSRPVSLSMGVQPALLSHKRGNMATS